MNEAKPADPSPQAPVLARDPSGSESSGSPPSGPPPSGMETYGPPTSGGPPSSGEPPSSGSGRDSDDAISLPVKRFGSATKRLGVDIWAFLVYARRRFSDDNLFQASASLTYTTLLSLVPLAAISIAILSAFPAFTEFQDDVQSLIFQAMVPEVGDAVLDQLVTLAENTGRLTAFGLIGIMVTAFLLLATIESAFNSLWRVRVNRPLLMRLLSFWAVLTVTPILAAFGISLTVEALSGDGFAGHGAGLAPAWITSAIAPAVEFTVLLLLFLIIPNRDVRYGDSVIGAAIGAVLLEIARWGFGLFISMAPTYETVYGALATVPIFLLWLYLVWSIVLIAALIAAALPDWRAGRLSAGMGEPGTRFHRLSAAVAVLDVLYTASRSGKPAARSIIRRLLGMGASEVDQVLEDLRAARFAAQTSEDCWVLARDIHAATLWDLVEAMGYGFGTGIDEVRNAAGDSVTSRVPDKARLLHDLILQSRQSDQEILSVPLFDIMVSGSHDSTQAAPPAR